MPGRQGAKFAIRKERFRTLLEEVIVTVDPQTDTGSPGSPARAPDFVCGEILGAKSAGPAQHSNPATLNHTQKGVPHSFRVLRGKGGRREWRVGHTG